MSNEGFGLFAGTAVNDTSSVTAAAAAWDGMHPGSNALDDATIVKLTRTLAIIPITLVLGIVMARKEGADGLGNFSLKRAFPMFILFFLVASIITTIAVAAGADAAVFAPAEDAFQVLHHHGHGRHWPEHRPREAREIRRQAHPHGPHLLDLHSRCQPGDATSAGTVVIVREEDEQIARKLDKLKGADQRIAERAAFSKPWPEGLSAEDLIAQAKDERAREFIATFIQPKQGPEN